MCVKQNIKVNRLGGGRRIKKLEKICSNLMYDKRNHTSLGSKFNILESINRNLAILGSSQEPRLIVWITFEGSHLDIRTF